jgi:hypothetical protein
MPKSILLLRQVNELLTQLWHSHLLIFPGLSSLCLVLMYVGIISSSLWIIMIEISERKRRFVRPEYRQQGSIKIEVIKNYKLLTRLI